MSRERLQVEAFKGRYIIFNWLIDSYLIVIILAEAFYSPFHPGGGTEDKGGDQEEEKEEGEKQFHPGGGGAEEGEGDKEEGKEEEERGNDRN